MTTPLQLLFASPATGDAESGQVATAPITVGLNGANRPQAVEMGGAHFEALTLGAQDLIDLASELSEISDFYPVEVDVRDRTMREPANADEIENLLLGYLRAGERARLLAFFSSPSSGLRMWAVGLSSPSFSGKLTVSRDGTLSVTAGDRRTVDLVVRALRDVLTEDG